MKRLPVIIMAIMIALSVTGCAIFSSERTAAAPLSPSISTQPAVTQTSEPGITYSNPVEEFYKSYFADSEKLHGILGSAIDGQGKPELLQGELEAAAHEMALSEARVSIGALCFDGSEYTASLLGAANGFGRMAERKGNAYEFSFDYTDGRTLKGAFDGRTLYFVISAESGDIMRCWLEKNAEGWYSAVESEKASALIIKGDKLMRFVGGIDMDFEHEQTDESTQQDTSGYPDNPDWDLLSEKAPYELIVDEFESEVLIKQ
jgi:hypothetical protein